MRFLMVHKLDERRPDAFSPSPEVFARMGALMEEMTKAGVLIGGEGVLPSATGAKVRFEGGQRTVVDGPFTEAKEVIAGFALINAASKEEAIGHATRFAEIIGDTEVEIRQVAEFGDVDPAQRG